MIALSAAAAAAGVQLLPLANGWQSAKGAVVTWAATTNTTWDGTTANWTGAATTYADGNAVQFPGTLAASSAVAVGNVTGGTPNGVSPATVDFTSGADNYTLTNSSGDTLGIQGAATLTLDSGYTGLVTLSSANSYTGGTYINGGTLHGGSGSFSSTNAFNMGGGTYSAASGSGGTLAVGQNFVVTSGTSSTITSTSTSNNIVIQGSISGGGANTVLNLDGGSTISASTMSSFTGTLELGSDGSGTVRLDFASSTVPAGGSPTAIFDLGGGSATLESYNGGGSGGSAFPNAIPLGALEGSSATTSLAGAGHSGSTFFAIGGLGLATTFAGTIKNTPNPVGIYVVGGSLTLTGNNTYGLGTTIQTKGSLFADNTAGSATGTAAVTVAGSQTAGAGTLGGNGTITGATTVNTTTAGIASFAEGGLIAPGASGAGGPVGTLTLSGGLTLNDYSNLDYTLNGASTASGNDLISTNNTALTLSGNSLVQVDFAFNNGDPANGSTYDLINYGSGVLSSVAGGSNASVSGWSANGVPAGYTATFTTPGNQQVDVTFALAQVPEPASVGLLAIGALGLLRRRRARVG